MRSSNTITGAATYFAICLLSLAAGNAAGQNREELALVNSSAHKNSLFTENKGQMADMDGKPVPFVLFKEEVPGFNLYITEKGLTYVFLKEEEEKHKKKKTHSQNLEREEELMKWERVDLILENAAIKKENVVTEGISNDFSQYYLSNCPDGIRNVHSFQKVTIKEVYPGIDWIFYNSTEKGVKYDFIVHPGADPSNIKLLYRSRKKIKIEENGNINIKTSHGNLTENAPVSYIKETNENIPTSFIITNVNSWNPVGNDKGFETEVTFDFRYSTFDIQHSTLIIDPQLYWATFFGGSGFDGPRSVATDNSGNVYVTGYTESANFPTQSGGGYFQGTFGAGTRDAFILKFSNTGARLWSTFYGGNQTDEGWSLATDNTGNLFVFGYTESANFATLNAGTFFQGTYGGQGDAFILKFDNAGNRLWATYYGGVNMEEGFGITADPSGNIFMTGETRSSTTFPLQNAGTFYQGTFGTGVSDAFILKFDNAGNRLWATYAGGYNTDMGNAITTDAAGNVFVTGYAWGGGFPLQNAGTFYQGAIAGAGDVFIMKFSNLGNLLWSTYYGGGASDEGNSIAVDASGNVFVTGVTASGSFPTLNAGTYYQGTKGGTWDTYMLKFDNAGNRLWATFFGGSNDEAYWQYSYDNLATDQCGNVYMTAETQSSDLPTQAPCDGGYFDNIFNGGTYDIFITQFSNTGTLNWSTYFGGSGNDFRSPIAVDNSNSLFVSGEWTEDPGPPVIPVTPATYPITNPGGGSYSNAFAGGHDGVMAKFEKIQPVLTTTVVNSNCGCTGTATVNATGICPPFIYIWSNGQTTQTATGLCAGNYSVTVGNNMCGTATASVIITSANGFTLTATSNPAACLSSNGSATVTPTGGQSPFTYSWSPSGGTNATATGLASGNYSVTVTDANGCTGTVTVAVTSTGGPSLALANQTNVSCNGGANGTATMNATGGTSPYTFSWSPTGGSSSAATGLSSGTYTATVTDANGCIQTQTVTINQPTAITATATATAASCGSNNGSATVNAAGGSGAYAYLWNPSSASTSAVSGLTSGNYSVIITDTNGCTSTNTVSVASTGSVTAVATNASICAGQTATLTASGGTNYSWSTGATTSSITATATATATYSVIVSTGLCSDTAVSILTINPSPTASAGNNVTVCTGSPVTLTATGGGTYAWNTGQTSASITATSTATATYSVTVTNSSGCTDVSSVTVFITPNIIANAGPDQTICAGETVQFNASGGTGYSWIPATGLSSSSVNNPACIPSGTTTYTVVVTSGSCTPATDLITVVVNPNPTAAAWSNVAITQGQNATLAASGGGTYSWTNGAVGSTITVTPLISTMYCVLVTDANNCTDTACVTVLVEPTNCSSVSTDKAFVLPSAFSPNSDGENDKWRLLYAPLLLDCIAEFHIAVYSRWGEKVFEGSDILFTWDGTYMGKPEGTAVFAYYLDAVLKDGTKISMKGNISLLR